MAPKAADCKNVHNPNLQCKNDFLPYFDSFFLSLLKVYDHKIIFSWPLCIFGSKITKKNVSLIFYPKIPNPPPLRPLWMVWGTYLEKNCPSSNGHILVFGGVYTLAQMVWGTY